AEDLEESYAQFHLLEEVAEPAELELMQGSRHKGEEGKMGSPTSKSKSGLYALKGPKDVLPQMARSFDGASPSREAGILGVMQPQAGHFVASSAGAAFAVGDDDADVWGGLTGSEVGASYGLGGLGLVGAGRGGGGKRVIGGDGANAREGRIAAQRSAAQRERAESNPFV